MFCPRCRYELETNQSICLLCGSFLLKSSPRDLRVSAPQMRREGSSLQVKQPGQTRALSSSSIEPVPSMPSLFAAALAPAETVASAGSLLCRGRYVLTEKQTFQQWAHGAYETHWCGRDLLLGRAKVLICEMELPAMKVLARQASLRVAMRALFCAGRHPCVPALLDVFRDCGRDFFVFQAIEGESLLTRLQRTWQMLPEQEAIEICLQMTEVLDAISQHELPGIHGLISPAHLLMTRNGRWILTDFSIVLASGAYQHLSDLDPSLLSPFSAPECQRPPNLAPG